MGKKILFISGLLAVLTFFSGRILHDNFHSPIADFIRFACFPFFTLVFLFTLFLLRVRRVGYSPSYRTVIRTLRAVALLTFAGITFAVCWPRHYGSLPMEKRPGMQYWDLLTGSRISYSLIPAKGIRKPYPVISLIGGPGGSFGENDIQKLTPMAEEGYDVYLYDQVGSGWSARLADIRDYTAARHKQDLEAIVQNIGAEKVILIGHSWGAILATLYAADNPTRVAAMILTGPGPIQPQKPGLDRLRAPDSLHLQAPYFTNRQGTEEANNIRSRTMSWVATQWGEKMASDKEADDFGAYLFTLADRSTVCDTSRIPRWPAHAGAGYYMHIMTVHSFSATPDPRPKLRNSSVPILVMKGQCDNQPWGAAEEYLELFPKHTLAIIPGAGHSISGEQPGLFYSTIRQFLKNLP
jgi:proline iminopeptidase